ncbi:MAG: FAD-dependent oxidoreductase [Verrucomicrobiota bacterium JB024]|nr:FAD-dependent oxidoreductase [Verrucomicrobiota bacterium JB024]
MNWTTDLNTLKNADVVVVGGGPAGIAAACAAARNGASTLLVEKNGCLGGMMTLGMVMPLAARSDLKGNHFGGILEEFIQRTLKVTREYCGTETKDHRLYSSPHIMKFVSLEMLTESGVDILFHTMLADVVREGDRIRRLIVCTKSGLSTIEGKIFIDATGDGDIIAGAGEQFVLGSEPGVLSGLTETGLDTEHDGCHYGGYSGDGKMQPASTMFTMGNVDYDTGSPFINRRLSFADLGMTREQFLALPYANTPGFVLEEGSEEVPLPQGRILFFRTRRQGEVIINMTRITGVNGADAVDLSHAEVLAQKQMIYVLDFLIRFVPGFQDAYLLETGAALGVRETRRLVGQYVLKGREAITCVPFADVIAHGSYIIDIHDPQGRKKAIGGEIQGDCYDIPYRSLLPRTVRNLLATGRCISSDHVAHSSTRIQGTCMLTGQAAGTASALSLRHGCDPTDVPVGELQQKLIAEDVRLRVPQLAASV